MTAPRVSIPVIASVLLVAAASGFAQPRQPPSPPSPSATPRPPTTVSGQVALGQTMPPQTGSSQPEQAGRSEQAGQSAQMGQSAQAGQSAPVQQPSVGFSTGTEAIRLDVLVTRGGAPVDGLTADDFIVLDNGAPQRVRLLGQGDAPIDIMLVLDVSGSVRGERLEQLIAGVRALLDRLRPGDRIGLITFSHQVWMPVPLTADAAQVRALLTQVRAHGATSLNDAAFLALLAGDPGVRTLAIVFTDGFDNASWLAPRGAVNAARRLDAVVYGLTMVRRRRGGVAPETVMELLPEATGGRRIETPRLDDVSQVFREILREFRQRYLLAYEPAEPGPAGWHAIAVTLKPGQSGRVRARPGYDAVGR